ncbi:MAG: hypothetical protein ACON5G_09935 [Pirellulaceae bacterium]
MQNLYGAPIQNSYDCVVKGGGPNGSATVALVVETGNSILLVEREALPRFHVRAIIFETAVW